MEILKSIVYLRMACNIYLFWDLYEDKVTKWGAGNLRIISTSQIILTASLPDIQTKEQISGSFLTYKTFDITALIRKSPS